MTRDFDGNEIFLMLKGSLRFTQQFLNSRQFQCLKILRNHLSHVTPSSSIGKSPNFGQPLKSHKWELRGSCTTAVNGDPVFDEVMIIEKLRKLQEFFAKKTISSFTIDMSPVPKLPQKQIWQKCNEHDIFAPDPCNNNSETSINIATIKSIAVI